MQFPQKSLGKCCTRNTMDGSEDLFLDSDESSLESIEFESKDVQNVDEEDILDPQLTEFYDNLFRKIISIQINLY